MTSATRHTKDVLPSLVKRRHRAEPPGGRWPGVLPRTPTGEDRWHPDAVMDACAPASVGWGSGRSSGGTLGADAPQIASQRRCSTVPNEARLVLGAPTTA